MKQFLYILLVTLATLFTVLGSLTLVTRAKLISEETYTTALVNSGLYQTTSGILQEQLTQTTISLTQRLVLNLGYGGDETNISTTIDRLLINLLNNLIQQLTNRLISDLFLNLKVETVIQATVEGRLADSLAWLRGEREAREIFNYIPDPTVIQNFKNNSFTKNLMELLLTTTGVSSLPVCQTDEEIQNNLKLAEQGRIFKVACTSPEIQTSIDNLGNNRLAAPIIDQVNTSVDQQLSDLGISPIIDTLTTIALSLAELKQSLLELRTYVALSKEYAIGSILIGLTIAAAAMFVVRTQKLITFFSIYLISGLALMLLAITFKWFISETLISQTALTNPNTFQPALSVAQSTQLALSFSNLMRGISTTVAKSNLYLGLIISGVAGLGIGISLLYQRWIKTRNSNQDSDEIELQVTNSNATTKTKARSSKIRSSTSTNSSDPKKSRSRRTKTG